jgi:hypothetical protein
MITCGECGKTNGQGKIGESWICADCKVSVEPPPNKEKASSDKGSRNS